MRMRLGMTYEFSSVRNSSYLTDRVGSVGCVRAETKSHRLQHEPSRISPPAGGSCTAAGEIRHRAAGRGGSTLRLCDLRHGREWRRHRVRRRPVGAGTSFGQSRADRDPGRAAVRDLQRDQRQPASLAARADISGACGERAEELRIAPRTSTDGALDHRARAGYCRRFRFNRPFHGLEPVSIDRMRLPDLSTASKPTQPSC